MKKFITILTILVFFWTGGCAQKPATDTAQSSSGMSGMEGMPGMEMSGKESSETTVLIPPAKQQLIGVMTEPVDVRPLTKTIRTVGRIEVDERTVAHLHIKFEGYIHELFVNTTGEAVEAGQALFSVYSPDLVATQKEYLLALKAVRELSSSALPEAAEGARSLLEATRRRLHLWDIEESHIEDLERTGQVQNHLIIHTPTQGVVLEKMAVVGMKVQPGEELYKIADLSKVWLLSDFYEFEIGQIKIGQKALIAVNAYPGRPFTGTIQYIYPYLEPETRTTKVRFELSNPDGKLKPQMYANVEMKIDRGRRLTVPSSAVLDSGLRKLVFIDKGNGRYEPREIKPGERADDRMEVMSGLTEGERVVTSANFLIDSESKLMAATSMMGLLGMGGIRMEQAEMGEMEMGGMEKMPGKSGSQEMKGMEEMKGVDDMKGMDMNPEKGK